MERQAEGCAGTLRKHVCTNIVCYVNEVGAPPGQRFWYSNEVKLTWSLHGPSVQG